VTDDGDEPAGRLGGQLQRYRETAGLSQRQLAALAGLSVGAVRDLEQGRTSRPRLLSVARLADALGLGRADREALIGLRAPATRGPAAPDADQSGRPGRSVTRAPGLMLGVLGPLTAWRDGTPVPLGSARQRAVLGLLAVHLATGVQRDAIVDMIWPADPPVSAVPIVQSQLSRLRRQLGHRTPGETPGEVLVSEGTRYRLAAGVQCDAAAFTELAERAAVAAAENPAAACELYEAALNLWRGAALEDVDLLSAHPAVVGLAWQRAGAVLGYAEAAIRAGCPDRVLGQLRALTAREPLNEKAHALLITVLTAAGQRAAALEAFEAVRRRLDADLGAAPSAELTRAHLRVLRETAGGPRRTPGSAPRQLPGAVPYFTGRHAELATLTGLADRVAGRTVVVSAVDGAAGVGKTALALQWAHQAAGRFPDGQLYLNLRGFGPVDTPMTPAEAIRRLLDGLGVAAERIPPGLDARVALYRSLLASRRMLVLLDNARDPAQVRPLLPHSQSCLVLVTSRHQLTGLAVADGASLVTLDVLSETEARELLGARLGADRIAAEPVAVTELTKLCARLPLALSVAAARAAARPGLPLALLAEELHEVAARLDGLGTGDAVTDIRTVFSWSCQQVSEPAARMFRLIGLHCGPDLTARAAASLAGLAPGQARQLLAELTRAHLVSEHLPGRFTCHDLLRAYAAEQGRSHEPERSRHAAVRRVLDHYLHTGFAASQLLHPYRDLITLEPAGAQVEPEPLADRQQALDWFSAERQVLLAAVDQAAGGGFRTHAWQLPWTMATFLSWQGYWPELATTQAVALATARHTGDLAGQALACYYLGQAKVRLGAYEEACLQLAEALELGQQLGSASIQARAHIDLARAQDLQGRSDDALSHTRQSLRLFRVAANRRGEADALNAIGWCLAKVGAGTEALQHCTQALAVFRELGNQAGEAVTLDTLGYIQHQLGRPAEAIVRYEQAIDVHGDVDLGIRAEILTHLGDARQAVGQDTAAVQAWQQALTILDDLNSPSAGQLREKLRLSPAPAAAR
jgi:DNA-binding SARP family transcriptional activator/transcriptional regulator with XRE-family HTH domain